MKFRPRWQYWVLAGTATLAGCEGEPPPVEPRSDGSLDAPAQETPTAGAKKQPQQSLSADNWEDALAAARAEGSKDAITQLALWLAERRDVSPLATLLSEDGKPTDEFSRQVFEAYSEALEAELASRRLRGSIQEAFENLASTDPWTAANIAFALGESEPDAAAVLQARAGWYAGKADREKALSRIIATSAGNNAAALSFGQGVLEEWTLTDTLSAAEWIEQMAPQQPRLRELSGVVAARLAAKSPFTAVQWLGRLPAAYGRAAAGPLAAGWAQIDPLAALEWGQEYSDGKNRENILQDAVASAAYVSPEIVLGWLGGDTRLGKEDRADLVRTASEAWARRDPRGSFRWLSENADKEVFFSAVEGGALALAKRDPRLATEIALLAVDERRGEETLLATLETWRKYRSAEFTSGVESLVSRLRDEGDVQRANALVSAAARAGQD